jgi:hypothetical protein
MVQIIWQLRAQKRATAQKRIDCSNEWKSHFYDHTKSAQLRRYYDWLS